MKNKISKNKELTQGMKEFEMAWEEFFKNKPEPKNEKEEKKEMEDFMNWYNNVRKQSDTGKTPSEMYEEIYGKNPPKIHKEISRIMNFKWDENYKEPHEILSEAHQCLIEGKNEKALSLAEEVLKIVPDEEESLLLKANALIAMKKYDEAKKFIDKTERIHGKDAYVLFYRANFFFHQGNFAKAFQLLREAIEKDSSNYDFIIAMANYLYLKNDFEYKTYFENARKIDKKRTDNFKKKFWLEPKELMNGRFLVVVLDSIDKSLSNKETKDALENINFLLLHEKYIPKEIIDIILGLEIECYFIDYKLDIADKKIEYLIARNNKNPHAYFYKAQLLFYNSKLSEALDFIDKCLEIAEDKIPHPDFYSLKGEILKEMDDDEYIYYENKGKELRKGLENLKMNFGDFDF